MPQAGQAVPAGLSSAAMAELILEGGTVVTPRRIGPGAVHIREGRIVRVGGRGGRAARREDVTGLLLLPGVVDAHVHFALPVAGTRTADDFLSGSRAALAGGVTTFVDFTVGRPGLPLPEAVEARRAEARPSLADYTFHVEMVGWTRDRTEEIRACAELGVRSFKFYLAYADSGRRTDLGTLKAALEAIREIGGVAMVHAEAEELVEPRKGPFPWARPSLSEEVAILEVGALSRATRCSTYVAHISSAAGLAALRWARRQGAPILGETCPHYLLLDESVYARPDGHRFSVTPPLRTPADQRALWEALGRGLLQAVATDHCAFTCAQKDPYREEPARLPSGLPGVETLLVLLYSEGVARGRLGLGRLAWYLSEGPARAFGLWPRKGALRPGADADLVLLDPRARWTLRAQDLHMATDFSPYEGLPVQGRVVGVLSRGEWVYREGEVLARPGRGQFIPWQS